MSTKQFNSRDLYEVLGLNSEASDRHIKKAFRKLSLKWHPDKNPKEKEKSEKVFSKITFAYGILSDPEKK